MEYTIRLIDLGYRVEQLVVRLTQLGLSTCYVGTLAREADARSALGCSPDVRLGAVVLFGHAATSVAGRMTNNVMRSLSGATHKMPAEHLFFADDFGHPCTPPPSWQPLIEAGRAAPSARNAQPWRFLWRERRLYLFAQRHNPKYGNGAAAAYRFYDTGLCMANLSLALTALGQQGTWQFCGDTECAIADYPRELQPLAVLEVN